MVTTSDLRDHLEELANDLRKILEQHVVGLEERLVALVRDHGDALGDVANLLRRADDDDAVDEPETTAAINDPAPDERTLEMLREGVRKQLNLLAPFRSYPRESVIANFRPLLNAHGEPTHTAEPGDPLTIRVRARAVKDLAQPVVGVLLRNRLGIDVWGTNTRIEGIDLGAVRAGEQFEVTFAFDCALTRQDYTLTVATQYPEGYSQDWLDDALAFSVVDTREVAGLANFKTKVEWRKIA
mgnify:CR=1 FL=1